MAETEDDLREQFIRATRDPIDDFLLRRLDEARAERDRYKAKLDAAETIIGKLQNLVVDVHGWVSHGCSETATAAMNSAMRNGWEEMGWRAYCDEKYKPPSTPR